MAGFSSLKNAVSNGRAAFSLISSPNLQPLLSQASSVLANIGETSSSMRTEVGGKVSSAAADISETCTALKQTLGQITSFLGPIFRAHEFVARVWGIVVDVVSQGFEKAFSALDGFLNQVFKICDVVSDSIIAIFFVLVALCLFLLVLTGESFEFLKSLWKTIIGALAGFAASFSAAWLPSWIQGFSCLAEQEAQIWIEEGQARPTINSSLVGSIGAFVMASLSVFFFSKQGLLPKDERNPFLQVLKSSGDFAQKCNQLFSFFRNLREECGTLLGWVVDTMCDTVGVQSPSLNTLNAYLTNDDLFAWLREVDAATSPENRLVRFADPEFVNTLKNLTTRAEHVKAVCATHPVVAFLSQRVHAALAKLDKEASAAISHKGVGQVRQEPFMVEWFGGPGIGKTLVMNIFCEDLLNLCGEPKANRVYCVPRDDAFWSGYAHQTAVFFDDLGQIYDGAGQCQDAKTIISVKSSHPVGLPMADLESKGTHFTSKYIFATANEPTVPPECGIMTPEAFDRRRDILFYVYGVQALDHQNPTHHLRFDVCSSFAPYEPINNLKELTYEQALRYTFRRAHQHFEKGKQVMEIKGTVENPEELAATILQEAQVFGWFSGLKKKSSIDPPSEEFVHSFAHETASIPLPGEEFEEEVRAAGSDFLVSSCKCAYAGSLAQSNFLGSETANHHYSKLSVVQQLHVVRWKTSLLNKILDMSDIEYWLSQIHSDWLNTCKARFGDVKFDNLKLVKFSGKEKDFSDCFDMDEDVRGELEFMPPRTRFAFLLLARYQASLPKVEEDEEPYMKSSWFQTVVYQVCEGLRKLPSWAKTLLKFGVVYMAVYGLSSAISSVLGFPLSIVSSATQMATASIVKEAHVSNISGDPRTLRASGSRLRKFLTAQASTNTFSWSDWSAKDPFFNNALIKNLCVLQVYGAVFRGIFINTNWIVTVKHAFLTLAEGTPFSLITNNAEHFLILDKQATLYIEMPDTDIVFINTLGCDGCKRDIRKHFVRREYLVAGRNTPACMVKPVLAPKSGLKGSLLSQEVLGTHVATNDISRVQYGREQGMTVVAARAIGLDANGHSGDCGSAVLIPGAINGQPEIVGIHCAGFSDAMQRKGYRGTTAALIFLEDIEKFLPATDLQEAQTNIPTIEEFFQSPFDTKQVFCLGKVPRELAADIPHDTALKLSVAHDILTEVVGPCTTEPSILTSRDKRLGGKSFDPYIAGIEKFNETAHSFNMHVAKEAFEYMKRRLLRHLAKVPVPSEKPEVRSEMVALNGIPGEEYYDPMDLSTSSGWPFNKGERGKSKRGHVVEVEGVHLLDRTSEAYTAYIELLQSLANGEVPVMITSECAKDERLPKEKIYEKPKTRLFTILPFHYNMLVRQYFLDFSASLMRSHNDLPCKVGIAFDGIEWTTLANQFLAVSDQGFSADYSSFDGRAPIFVFQWFCDLVSEYYGDDLQGENARIRRGLLMMASSHLTLCGDKLFSVKGGMPSGFSLTVIFNSLLNEFYMRYAFGMLLLRPDIKARSIGVTMNDFDRIFIAVYGDDNMVAVPMDLSWYTLPRIAEELGLVNVVIKSGLDKNADVSSVITQPLSELMFLSRGFVRHHSGYYLAPLKWRSVVECLYWVRCKSQSGVEAFLENVETAMREAFYHGSQVFRALELQLEKVFGQLSLEIPHYETFSTMETKWLEKVTGDSIAPLRRQSNSYIELPEGEGFPSGHWAYAFVEVYPDIFTCSVRHYNKNPLPRDLIVINCTNGKSVKGIRGPTDWRDLESKVWAYTMSAIDQEQVNRLSEGRPSGGLLFVSQDGESIAVVLAALAALAGNKYTPESIVRRFVKITGTRNIMRYGAGTGHYLMASLGCSFHVSQARPIIQNDLCVLPSEVLLQVGGCKVLANVYYHKIQTDTIPYWVTHSTGYAGVNSSIEFVREDLGAEMLANAIRMANAAGGQLHIFFYQMTPAHAAWILEGNRKAGFDVSKFDGPTLFKLLQEVDDECLYTIPAYGHFLEYNRKTCQYDVCFSHQEEVPYLFEEEDAALDLTYEQLRDLVRKAPSKFRCKRLITHLKCLIVSRKERSLALLKHYIEEHVGNEGSVRYMLFVLVLGFWSGVDFQMAHLIQMMGTEFLKLRIPRMMTAPVPGAILATCKHPEQHGGEAYAAMLLSHRHSKIWTFHPKCSALFALGVMQRVSRFNPDFGDFCPKLNILPPHIASSLDLAIDMLTQENIHG
nr:polyprotein [Squash chlorotic leaf spot virus]